jgi:hypothetical protein
MSCAKHIETNVSQKYGTQCGQYVVAMAKSFSTRYLSELLDDIRAMKEAAATHLEGTTMSGILWRSSQWLNANPCLPPSFGHYVLLYLCVSIKVPAARGLGRCAANCQDSEKMGCSGIIVS